MLDNGEGMHQTGHRYIFLIERELESCRMLILNLKEQYPVTAHAPNFDFWTGCREIKRCEEQENREKSVCFALGRVQ